MLEVTQQPRQSQFTWAGWRLEFSWHLDRWQHTLWRNVPTGWQGCLISLEGTSDQAWPDSPAFQNAYVERMSPTCAEIQLLGQAGKNHYSAAVRCDSDQQVVDFDIAVRIHETPPIPLVLSTYRIISPVSQSNLQTVWDMTTERLAGQPEVAIDWMPHSPQENATACLRMHDLKDMRAEKLRATLRWKYRWRLKPNA